MPFVTLSALVILVTIALVTYFVVPGMLLSPGRSLDEWLQSPAWFVLQLFNSSLDIVLLAPFFIAIHRYVVRGDVARLYPLHPLKPSYLRYVGTALALNLAYRLPDLIRILAPGRDQLSAATNVAIVVVTFSLMLTVALVVVRKIALFPAIAVNAPKATWHAFAPADAGNTFRIILVLFGTLVPGMICGVLLTFGVQAPRWPDEIGGAALSLALALLQLLTIAVAAAAMARIYTAMSAPVEAREARAGTPAVA